MYFNALFVIAWPVCQFLFLRSLSQIYIRIRDDEWNVYRRYSQFRELHYKMKKAHALINTFEFPPKKAVGNKVGSIRLLLQWESVGFYGGSFA